MKIFLKLAQSVHFFILLTGFLLIGCKPKENVLRIAVAVPLTGDIGTEGQGIKRAVELAVHEANASKRFPMPIVVKAFDDRADPKEAVNVANMIVSDPSIVAVVGHYNSGCSIPASQVYSRAGLAMISPASTNPKLTLQQLEPSWTTPRSVFRVVATDDLQGSYAADFVYNRLNLKQIAVVHDKTPYGQGLAEEFQKGFEKQGGAIITFDGITVGDKDFKALLTKINDLHPEGLYFGGLYTEAGLLLKQMKEMGMAVPFISGDGAKTDTLYEIAGEAADGAYLTIVGVPVEQLETAKDFLTKYKAQFPNQPVKPFDHFGYEAANIILDVTAKTGINRGALIEGIRTIKHQGVLGTTAFDTKGDTLNKIITMTRADFKNRAFPTQAS